MFPSTPQYIRLVTTTTSPTDSVVCTVVKQPGTLISSGSHVNIEIPAWSLYGIRATINRIHMVHSGYTVFKISEPDRQFHYLAVPTEWALFSLFQRLRFWYQIKNDEPFPTFTSNYGITPDYCSEMQAFMVTIEQKPNRGFLQVPQIIRRI